MGITKPRPLVREDERMGFDCGKESLNQWFQHHAWKNQASNVSRTNVVCDTETGEIVGYVSLATTEIRCSLLTKNYQRNRPDPVPAVLLGQLAVDRQHQGRGIASHLLLFTFRTALNIAAQAGSYGIVTHPVDDNARSFYVRWGFADNPFDPDGSMLIRMSDLVASQ